MFKIDSDNIKPESTIPLYKQVAQSLLFSIQNGDTKIGDKLPSEMSLMGEYKVSRITIRAAIKELVDDGILERSQGKGTFIAASKNSQGVEDRHGLTESCRKAGKSLYSKVLSIDFSYPTKKEAEFLHIPETEKIIETKRLRYIDGLPAMIETNHLLKSYKFLFEENLEGSLFQILSEHGITVKNTSRTLEIAYADGSEASLLNIKRNTPLLMFHDYQSDSDGNPFYVSKQLYNIQNTIFYF